MNIEKASFIVAFVFILIAFILGMNNGFIIKKTGRSYEFIEVTFYCLGNLILIINVLSTYYKFKRYKQMTFEIACILTATIFRILTYTNMLENIYSFISIFPLILIIVSRVILIRLHLKKII